MSANMKIYKYPLEKKRYQTIELPAGAKVLRVDQQVDRNIFGCEREDGPLVLWAYVNPESKPKTREVWCLTTGEEANDVALANYVNTILLHNGAYVLHVFVR